MIVTVDDGKEAHFFWFSLCPKLLGVNEKLCIPCESWGSSLRAPGSPTIVRDAMKCQ